MDRPAGMTPTAGEIEAWMVARVGALTGVPPQAVDARAPLTRHGLDSVALIALAADLEKWLGYRFRENPLADHPTIEALARYTAEKVAQQKSG
ncbi:MAG TPA: acyl carrier protein [Gemmataceae bacterium]|nr:acyl carrier protein [Gemmataceae bacterium]